MARHHRRRPCRPLAVYACMGAAMDGARAFAGDRTGPVLGRLLLARLSTAAGVGAPAWPGITALALTIWVGAWALTTGFMEVALAFQRGRTAGERAWFLLNGLVSIALAFVLFVRPDIGAVSLATVFGLFSIVHSATAPQRSSRPAQSGTPAGPGESAGEDMPSRVISTNTRRGPGSSSSTGRAAPACSTVRRLRGDRRLRRRGLRRLPHRA
ncbi:DUF308 domain-containing protein [Streptomyces sp. GbtcB6]|uniref:HdeD family acid-resistance protein n=1 Tax=Streptomyces sp. GbtcB6 TaxID=2824751 RepID=UPI0027E3EAF9|nr:DUF308 domain-containing protein [Streptomyces sp. GbtcB6]